MLWIIIPTCLTIGWYTHKLHDDGTFEDWWYSYKFMQFRNIFLFPIIIVGSMWKLKKTGAYKKFRLLSYRKMYKWQWRILDRVMGFEQTKI